VAGSTDLGENVSVGPSSSIMNKLNIGNNATIGAGAVVFKNVASNITVLGNPARVIR
jgi:serine O-acetyltransferase